MVAETMQGGFWQLTAGQLISGLGVLLGLIVQAILYLRAQTQHHAENKAALAELLQWKEKHNEEADQRDRQINELGKIAASSQSTLTSVNDSLKLLQQELRDVRNRDNGEHNIRRGGRV